MADLLKVWVVDDDPIAVTIMRHLLSKHPEFELTESFDNADQALVELLSSRQKPDLIILDLNMPTMSGWELLDALVMNEYDSVPVVISSSSIARRDILKSSRYSKVLDHFEKPMTREILNEICTALKEYRLHS